MILRIKPKADRKRTLEEYISRKRLKTTRQRDMIFDQFFNNSDRHATVEDLYDKIKKTHPRIGYATIYRTLKLFKDCGLAIERNFGEGKTRYEPVTFEGDEHDHLICVKCGKIICFKNSRIEHYSQEVARLNDFEITKYKVELYGHCSSCR